MSHEPIAVNAISDRMQSMEISKAMIEKSFSVGKDFYHKKITRKKAVELLEQIGMNENSAGRYLSTYSKLIQGELFTSTINADATRYYLQRIFGESGESGLQNALSSLSQHIDYYERKTGTSVQEQKEIRNEFLKFIDSKTIIYADEVDEITEYAEGKTKAVLVNVYERNSIARKICIEHFGVICRVCSFDFEKKYGEIGKEFIHVHHKVDISTIGEEYSVDPINDLIPVCPNCHSMLHKKKPAYTVEELKQMM